MIEIRDLPIVSNYVRGVYNEYLQAPEWAFDIETDASDYHWLSGNRGLTYNAEIILISFYAPGLPALVLKAEYKGVEKYEAEYFHPERGEYGIWDFALTKKKRVKDGIEEPYYAEKPLERYLWEFADYDQDFIKKMFRERGATRIAHNLVFDARNIYGHFNIPVPRKDVFYDTQAMGITTGFFNPDKKKDLFSAIQHLLGEEDLEWLGTFKKADRIRLATILVEQPERLNDVLRYSAFDSVAAWELYQIQKETPVYGSDRSDFLLDRYGEVIQTDIDYTRWCVELAARGIKLDVDYAKQKRDEYFSILKEKLIPIGLTLEKIWLTGNEKFLRWYFFGLCDLKSEWVKQYPTLNLEIPSDPELLKRKPFLITKGGKPSFSKKAMEYYLGIKIEDNEEEEEPEDFDESDDLHHADLAALKEFKEAEAAWRRCEEFLRHAERDGRIHTIMQSLTNTGRSSSKEMNLMNIKFPLFSGFLIPDEGYSFVELDGSNAEKHVGAMMAADSVYEKVCCQEDYHTAMMPIWGVTDRKTSKIITFGTDYGMGVQKLSWSLGISYDDAKKLIDNKKAMFAATTKTQEKVSNFANFHGFTTTWTGRRIRIKTQINQRTNQREYKAYTAYNGTVQGGVGDWTKRSILQVDEYCHNSRLRSFVALQVHDSLIIAVKDEEYNTILPEAIEIMATIIPDEWANRTTPRFRMLCDYVPRSNCKKWGFVNGKEYVRSHLFNQYLNRWGWHEHTPEDFENGVDRVWINGHGWGEKALEMELQGQLPQTPPDQPQVSYKGIPEPFDWKVFQDSLQEAEAWLRMLPIDINGRVEKFSFVEGIEVLREICHKGGDNHYLTILESFDKMVETAIRYKEWRERNRNC